MRQPLALAAVVVIALLASAPPAAATTPPVSYGKTVLPGAFGVPFGQGAQPWNDLFADGDLVYDTQLSIEVVNANPQPVTVVVAAEEWTQGTQLELVNVTQANGTTVPTWINEPARLDASWSNSSLTIPGSPPGGSQSGSVSVPLPHTDVVRPLEVHVGLAVWELHVLTPATSSLAGVYSVGGLSAVELLESAVTTAVILSLLVISQRFARRVHRTPRVSPAWPTLWVATPTVLYLFDFVQTNQILGSVSAYLYPVFIGVAAFPYMPRIWRDFQLAEFEGVEALNPDEATNPRIVLPVVKTKGGLRCVPETWREVLYTLIGVPMPEIRGAEVTLLGRKLRVQPRGMLTSCPLPDYYKSEVDAGYWFDARHPIRRIRHRLEWTRSETVDVPPSEDGTIPASTKVRRRFSPHVVPGYLEATCPPKPAVALELAGIRDAETEAHDVETYRMALADMIGVYRHNARQWAAEGLSIAEESFQVRSKPRSPKELEDLVKRNSKRGRGERQGEAPAHE